MANNEPIKKTRVTKGHHPFFVKLRDRLGIVLTVVIFALIPYRFWQNESEISHWIYDLTGIWHEASLWVLAFASSLLTSILLFIAMHFLLQRRKRVTITPDSVNFTRWGISKTFERLPGTKFVIRLHDRARTEQRYHQKLMSKAQLKGKVRYPRLYYQISYTLSFEYMLVNEDIMSIYGDLKAEKALNTLIADMAEVDGLLGTGKGIALKAEDEWRPQAGGLPKPSSQSKPQ